MSDDEKAKAIAIAATAFCGPNQAIVEFLKAERLMYVKEATRQASNPAEHAHALVNLQRAAACSASLHQLFGDDSWL